MLQTMQHDRKPAQAVWTSLLTTGVCSSLCSCASVPVPAPDSDGSRRAGAAATVERLFAGMRTRDEALMRGALAETFALAVVDEEGEPRVSQGDVDEFVRSFVTSPRRRDERIAGEPLVRVDGGVAVVWTPYVFFVDGQLSHCGFDGFHLVRGPADEAWKIVAIAYTRRRGDVCEPFVDAARRRDSR